MVAGTHASDARTPKKVNIRRASEQKIRRVSLGLMMMEVVGLGDDDED